MSEEIMADIQRSLGRIENKVDTALAWQTKHVQDDTAMFAVLRSDIQTIQLGRAKQAGKSSVITTILTTGAGMLGGLVSWILSRGHH